MDLRIEKRNLTNLMGGDYESEGRQNQGGSIVLSNQASNSRAAGGSVNRNFIDQMSGVMGMSDDKQK